jgi:hypothetical protein
MSQYLTAIIRTMQKTHLIAAIALVLISCGPGTHSCAKDGKLIIDLNNAVIVAVERTQGAGLAGLLHFDEQYYKAMPIATISAVEHAPVDDIALGYRDRLFCCEACAAALIEKKNHAVDSVREVRQLEHIRDSLVLDSIHRGLL